MFNGTCLNDFIPVWDTISGKIADGPDSLVNDTGLVLVKELDKDGDAALIDYGLTLCSTTGAHICQYPGSLKL